MNGGIDLRAVRANLRSCPLCRSWELLLFNCQVPGTGSMDASIVCMGCGLTLESDDILRAARRWGIKEARA